MITIRIELPPAILAAARSVVRLRLAVADLGVAYFAAQIAHAHAGAAWARARGQSHRYGAHFTQQATEAAAGLAQAQAAQAILQSDLARLSK